MDKNAIKKYAVWARRELIERVSQRALIYGISAEDAGDPNADSVNGHLLSQVEKRQRQALIARIREKGFQQVMEEVAYTWFNRFAALRFMEVNGYLPTHIRVFTNDAGEFKPQILTEAIHLELDGLDMNRVYELENANKSEELFKYLLIVQCNALNTILPGMFQKIEDYTELLLPDNLLREGSVIEQMVTMIPEEDWTDQVQIIGWLYQYYNTEPKDKVFADLKKNIKISKENIPAATQLFTPDWIVHYMVENSLGRLWLEGHPNDTLKSEWKYYLDEAEQEPEVQAQLAEIRNGYAALKPEEIRVIDPCMGSGHILCVLFDVLVRIYEDYGYTAREAAVKIVENNLWGLDIDERAAQLSYFAVMMKARQYDRRFFTRKVQPHVYAIEESNGITSAPMHDMGLNLSQEEYGEAVKQAMRLVEEMHDAKEYGSLVSVTPCNWELLRSFAVPREEHGQLHLDIHGEVEASAKLQSIINIGEALGQKYHAVVTNPPYINGRNMNSKLVKFVTEQYTDYKYDFFSAFMVRCSNMTRANGKIGFLTPYVWMFIQSYDRLRTFLYNANVIESLIQFEYSAFEEATVPVCTFTFSKSNVRGKRGSYLRLTEFRGGMEVQRKKTLEAIANKQCGFYYEQSSEAFAKIPGQPVAYWVEPGVIEAFDKGKTLSEVARTRQGLASSDNNRFLKLWWEPSISKIGFSMCNAQAAKESSCKWFPCNKGGEYRKWYGNNSYVVNWENDGQEMLAYAAELYGSPTRTVKNITYYFMEGMTWGTITSAKLSMRHSHVGFIPEHAGGMIPLTGWGEREKYLLGLMNSSVAMEFLTFLSPTLRFTEGPVGLVPVLLDKDQFGPISKLVDRAEEIAVADWDSSETSWDFRKHPMLAKVDIVEEAFARWDNLCRDRISEMKGLEEEINRAFAKIYQLSSVEITEQDQDVTLYHPSVQEAIKGLISYAVGCMFGRYSLDVDGLCFAGGDWVPENYVSFLPDRDNIIPICDDEYFDDDIVGRFVRFIETVYGKKTLEQNLRFIADALGGKGSSREVIRNYFINDFYADHCSMYSVSGSGKRPIYWLFDSGKKNGFKCLIYMHRYQPDTIARIRTDYVHEQQSRYRTAIADLETRIANAGTSERVKLTKQLTKVQEQAEELRVYEEKIHHLADQMIRIDLDDGVKVNYAKFQDVLAKIK